MHEYTITWREFPEDREHAKSENYTAHDAVNLIANLLHGGAVEVSAIRQDVFDQENGLVQANDDDQPPYRTSGWVPPEATQ